MTRRVALAVATALAIAPLAMAFDASAQTSRRQQTPRGNEAAPLPSTEKPEKNYPLGSAWAAISLNGKPINEMRATFQVDASLRGTGFGGCNTFSASAYPLRQQGFAVGPLALTKRACDKRVQDFERTYLTALRGARNWDVVGGKLVLKGAAGELRFDRAL